MARKWTEQQLDAIKARGGSILVSAAAGSGKTAVLVERVIEKITNPDNPCDADKLLVVTFTNAAAAEMRERVGRRIDEMIAENPDDQNLLRQQILLQNAHISTIHAFCLDIIRENFQKLDISPDFRIADENEVNILKRDILNEILEEKYASELVKEMDGVAERPFLELSETLSARRDDARLEDTILRLYSFIRSLPDPDSWLDRKLSMYGGDTGLSRSEWGESAFHHIESSLQNAAVITQSALSEIHQSEQMEKAYAAAYESDLALLQNAIELVKKRDWNSLHDAVSSFEFQKLGALRKFDDDLLKERVKSRRDAVKGIISDLAEGLLCCTEEGFYEDLARLYPAVNSIFSCVRELNDRLNAEKTKRNILDFSDLEQFALKLLVTDSGKMELSQTAHVIESRFEEILVDEYQDTNLIQDTIFRAVSKNGKNLFMVGDVKQSIYRFRQAMPEIFIRKKEAFRLYDKKTFPAKIILGNNFRSRRGVTSAINFIFRRLMSKELGEIEYNSEEELIPAAVYPEKETCEFELHITDLSDYEGSDSNETLEARHLAQVISDMVASGETVGAPGEERPITWRDFCILLRSTSSNAEKFGKELSLCGVPVYADVQNGFLDSYEISVTLSFLRLIDNPLQDVPLLAVMMSPVFGFLPDDLAKIRIHNRKDSLYLALVDSIQNAGDDCEKSRFEDFLYTLNKFRRVAAVLPSDEILLRIYEETGLMSVFEAMKNGEKRRANLRLLLEYAKNYESAGYRGISGFIRLMDRLQSNNGDLAPAAALSESANVVRVMSIHKSKGLEFPVCIVAGCQKQFNTEDLKAPALFSPAYGYGSYLKDKKLGYRYTTLPREVVKLETRKSSLSEEMRVLYVAMTRAREKLILSMALRNTESAVKGAAALLDGNRINPFFASKSQGFAEWILAAALCHPSCGELREIAGVDASCVTTDSGCWRIVRTRAENRTKSAEKVQESAAIDQEKVQKYAEIIKSRVEYQYPGSELAKIPSKLSVSEIAHGPGAMSAELSRPAFLDGFALTPAEAGTALHRFMQYADLPNISDESGIIRETERLIEQKFILRKEGESIGRPSSVKKMVRYLSSPVYQRIKDAQKVFKEFQFHIEVPVNEIYPEMKDNGEKIVVQGMADLVFIENGAAIILDYKTDYANDGSELFDKYHRQLEIYAKAVAEIMGLPVKEKFIYSFHLGEAIEV